MKLLQGKLTYANVVATVALFIAVGGASAFAAGHLAKNSVGSKQLKKNAVTTVKVKDGAITGAKVNLSSLGTVPSATSAGNAASLGGTSAAGFAKVDLEPVHVIGASGQPTFEFNCENFGNETATVGFYKDPFGVVHLRGYITKCAEDQLMFTLPSGFRPPADEFFATSTSNETAGLVEVQSGGPVLIFGGENATLSGIEFRTH